MAPGLPRQALPQGPWETECPLPERDSGRVNSWTVSSKRVTGEGVLEDLGAVFANKPQPNFPHFCVCMDPQLFGFIDWGIRFSVSARAADGCEEYNAALRYMLHQTQLTPCEICRRYGAMWLLRLLRAAVLFRQPADLLILTCHLRQIVDAKLIGCFGETLHPPRVFPTFKHTIRRESCFGVDAMLSDRVIFIHIMFQVVRIEQMLLRAADTAPPADSISPVRRARIRLFCVVFSCSDLAISFRRSRPGLSDVLLRTASSMAAKVREHDGARVSPVVSARALFALLQQALVEIGMPAECAAELRPRLLATTASHIHDTSSH